MSVQRVVIAVVAIAVVVAVLLLTGVIGGDDEHDIADVEIQYTELLNG